MVRRDVMGPPPRRGPAGGGRRLDSLLHAARLDIRAALDPFQTADLGIQRRHLPL
jgi:hypothetical protein